MISLQILQPEFHPSSQIQDPTSNGSGAKEALSVYGLFHHLAHTTQGKQRLRQNFLRPSTDVNILNDRLDFISVFLRPVNSEAMHLIVESLKGIKNLRPLILNLRRGATGQGKGGGTNSGIWSSLRSVSIVIVFGFFAC